MITPNQSEILGFSLRTSSAAQMQGLFLEGHSSAKRGTDYRPAPTACTQATQKYDARFLL